MCTCRRLLILVALAPLVALVGCGDRDRVPEAQPGPDTARFTEGGFDGLPKVPGTDPVGERSESRDVVAQSFRVRNRTPEQVMDFYRSQLPGWSLVANVEKVGVNTFRGTWRRENRELTVSAASAPTLSEDDEVVSQYSLSLHTG